MLFQKAYSFNNCKREEHFFLMFAFSIVSNLPVCIFIRESNSKLLIVAFWLSQNTVNQFNDCKNFHMNRFPSFSMTKSLRSKRWWLFPDMPCSEMEYKNRHFKLLHCRANPKTSASYAPHEGQIGLLNLTGALVSERTHRTCQAGREHDWQLWLNRSRPKWSCRNLTQTNDTER